MKRIKKQLQRLRKKPTTDAPADSRITNETVAEHREQILAGGRRFKYPVQYSRYKLVINSIIIGVASLVSLVLLFWWQLYIVHNDSKFMYRFTQLVPVPVANVDGENVPYSDYLKRFRSSIHYLKEQNNLNPASVDGKKEVAYHQRQELNNAIRDSYVRKLARENNVKVTERDVNDFIAKELEQKKVSQTAYEKTVLNNFYDWSMSDYRSVVRADLLERKVSFAIDTPAREKADRVMAALRAEGANFEAIAQAESDDPESRARGGDSGVLPINSFDPNGVISAVTKLQQGQTTELIYGSDGYYIAQLTSKTPQNIQFRFIKIGLNELNSRYEAVKKADKIEEYITLEPQEE